MISIKPTILALCGLTLTAALNAQSTATAVPSPASVSSLKPAGLLGVQYTELTFGVRDITHTNATGYGVGAKANTALVPGQIDGGASYSYDWNRGGGARGHANTIGGYLTAYAPMEGVKPFVAAGLGWEWTNFPSGNDNRALWTAAVGVEIPLGIVSFTPRISYHDDFDGTATSGQQWTYGAEANYWCSRTSSVFASVGFSEVRHSRFDAWNYVIGLRTRF